MPRTAFTPIGFVPFMFPTLVEAAPDGAEWLHEVKYDGYRTQVVINGKSIWAFTRNAHDWTERYAPVVASARQLRCKSAIIDGEMCVQDEAGVTRFNAMRSAIRNTPERLVLFAFDLLYLDGQDLRDEPLLDRRRRLQDLIGTAPAGRIHLSEHHVGEGPAFFRAAERHHLEGIVSKRPDSRYVAGESRAWLKTKSFALGDFQVIGVERSSTGVPEVLLATTGDDPAFVGRAVVGLADKARERFWSDVDRLGTPRSRLKGAIAKRKASWVKEGLVARVRHLRGEEMLRHASVKAVGSKGELPGDVEARHPKEE